MDTVIKHLESWPKVEKMTLKQLTLRLIMLLALVPGQRGQTLHTLKVNDLKFKGSKCVIGISAVLKQTKAGSHAKPLEFEVFSNKKLCVVTHLQQYLQVTARTREGKQLFISVVKPHKEVSKDIVSRWIKSVSYTHLTLPTTAEV